MSAAVLNLSDEDSYDIEGFPLPGRSWRVGLLLRLLIRPRKDHTMTTRLALVVAAGALLAAAAVAQADPAAWIVTTDYSTFGRVRSCDGPSPWTVSADLATIPGDAVGRQHGGLVYIVGRGGSGVLQVYDPAAGFALVHEFSLGAGRNPQDIAFDAAGEAYVPCYDTAELLRVDVANETVIASYGTAAFADADGLPETAWCAAAGDRLYVACQRLDRNNWYGPAGPGAILVFDTAAEQWVDMDPAAAGVQPIVLQGANPYTRLVLDGTTLAVGCDGWFGAADGGIETVDLTTGASLGYAVTEAALGGDVLAMVPDGDCWLALVSDASFVTSVRRACPGGVTVLDTGSGYVHADLLLSGDSLLVLDRTAGRLGPAGAGPGDGRRADRGRRRHRPAAVHVHPAGRTRRRRRPCPRRRACAWGRPDPTPATRRRASRSSGVPARR